MAIVSCPECGKDLSDAANFCPHCGYPVEPTVPCETVKIRIVSSGEHSAGQGKISVYEGNSLIWSESGAAVAEIAFGGPATVTVRCVPDENPETDPDGKSNTD